MVLTLAGENDDVKDIFDVVKGGRVPLITLTAQGNSLSDLGETDAMVIRGQMQDGEIYIPDIQFDLKEAAGEVVTTWPEIGLGRDKLRQLRPLLGYGPDTAAIAYTYAYPPQLSHIEDPDAVWDRAHNETLDLLTTQGWLGLAAYVALGIACARRGWALWRTG